MLFLVTGGSGSGKSSLAENLICQIQTHSLYYLATMEIWDAECRRRVERHRKMRAGKSFITVEVPHHLETIVPKLTIGGAALLECMGNLLANEQFNVCRENPDLSILRGIEKLQKRLAHVCIVTNDIHAEDVPADTSTREYLRQMGQIGCVLARQADIVIEACCGLPIFWKGEKIYHEIMDTCITDRHFHV